MSLSFEIGIGIGLDAFGVVDGQPAAPAITTEDGLIYAVQGDALAVTAPAAFAGSVDLSADYSSRRPSTLSTDRRQGRRSRRSSPPCTSSRKP